MRVNTEGVVYKWMVIAYHHEYNIPRTALKYNLFLVWSILVGVTITTVFTTCLYYAGKFVIWKAGYLPSGVALDGVHLTIAFAVIIVVCCAVCCAYVESVWDEGKSIQFYKKPKPVFTKSLHWKENLQDLGSDHEEHF